MIWVTVLKREMMFFLNLSQVFIKLGGRMGVSSQRRASGSTGENTTYSLIMVELAGE